MPRSKRSTLQCASLNEINTVNEENLSPVASPPLLVPTSSLAALQSVIIRYKTLIVPQLIPTVYIMSQSPTMLIWMRSHLGTTFIWTIRYSRSKFLVVHITNIHTKSLYKYFWDFTSPRARERARNLCKMMICRFWAEFGLGRLDTFRGDIARTHILHQQNDKKLSAFLGCSGCRPAHKCAVCPKSQDYEAIWGPQLKA